MHEAADIGPDQTTSCKEASNESENTIAIMRQIFMGVRNSTEHCSSKCPGGHFQSRGVCDVVFDVIKITQCDTRGPGERGGDLVRIL